MSKKHTVICQKWEESEVGWGTRPDGYTLHLTEDDRKAFIKAYWNKMPKQVPEEYSRPCGTPYTVQVTEAVYQKIAASKKKGVWELGTPPGSGGTDGWIPTT